MLAPCDVFPLRPLGKHPVFLLRQCHAELASAWRHRRDSVAVPADQLSGGSGPEVEIDARARPSSHAGLAAAELEPGRSRPEYQDAPSATPAGRRMDGDSQAQPGMAPADARDQTFRSRVPLSRAQWHDDRGSRSRTTATGRLCVGYEDGLFALVAMGRARQKPASRRMGQIHRPNRGRRGPSTR
jgi:hypothetical protein